MIIKKFCLKCKHQWLPRTENPRECPKCKTRNWEEDELKEEKGKDEL